MSNNNNRPMYYSKIRVDPTNPDIVYTTGASAYKSIDGGKTFSTMDSVSHSDHHALWIDPRNNQHLVIGNDGGLDISYDQGATWEEISLSALGQFYAISVDMRNPYYVCGGLQDNGSWCGPSAVRSNADRHHEQRLVSHRRRRRFLHRQRPARLDDRVFGVAGRQHESL